MGYVCSIVTQATDLTWFVECFHDDESKFTQFMEKVFSVALSEEISLKQRELIIVFLSNCFQSLEDELIRTNVLPYGPLQR